jgi:hypothetical protein
MNVSNPILKVLRKVFRRSKPVTSQQIAIIPFPLMIPTLSYGNFIEYGNNMSSPDNSWGIRDRLMTDTFNATSQNSPKTRSPLGIPKVSIFHVKDFPHGMMCAMDDCNHIFLDGELYVARPIKCDVYGVITYLDVCTQCNYKNTSGSYGR